MFRTLLASALLGLSSLGSAAAADDLASEFARPPESARPWVYWFWLNSNITKVGITADLEAMNRVGVGGVLIMEVDQGAPGGTGSLHERPLAGDVPARHQRSQSAGPGSEHEQRRRLERQRRTVDSARRVDAGGRLDRNGSHGGQGLRGRSTAALKPRPVFTATLPCWLCRAWEAGGLPTLKRRRRSRAVASTNHRPAPAAQERRPSADSDLTAADGRGWTHFLGSARGPVDGSAAGSYQHGRGERARAEERPRTGMRQAEPRGHRGELRRD